MPDIIKDLSERKILQTGKGNYLTIEMLGEKGQIEHYEVYFSLRKPGKKQALKLYIESAYIRDPSMQVAEQKRRQQAIKFAILVYKVKNDQKIPYKK
ncbi:MAG: hypothetical protein GY927_16230 [bacterium]|nr:hypothetical protein [bacterium]